MPSTRIETRRGWLGGHRSEFIETVQRALQTGLRISESDRDIRLLELEETAMATPPGAGPHYLVIQITLFSGRSLNTKRRLYRALATELSVFGIPPEDIKIILIEVPMIDWGLNGRPASEADISFEVNA